MPEHHTSEILRSYVDALNAHADFAAHFDDDVTFELIGTPQAGRGRDAAREAVNALHTEAFDGAVKVRSIVADRAQAVLEAEFTGTHTGEFLGLAATGKQVNVPYCVVYDIPDAKITALRIYMPLEVFHRQLGAA